MNIEKITMTTSNYRSNLIYNYVRGHTDVTIGGLYWWAYPSRIVLFILLPIYVGCAMIDKAGFALYGNPVKYLSDGPFWLGLFGLLAFATSAALYEPNRIILDPPLQIAPRRINGILSLLYLMTLIAYAILLLPVMQHPALVVERYQCSVSECYEIRETLIAIPGITTFMSFQSLCITLHLSYTRLTKCPAPKLLRLPMIALIVACILRAWLCSERIAILELIIPAFIIKFSAFEGEKKKDLASACPAFRRVCRVWNI
jgi:hypothetical protein